MPEAIGVGMRATRRARGVSAAVSTIRPPVTMKAPTARDMPMPLVAAIRAAPGVDHAVTIGRRCQMLKPAVVAAMARLRPVIQETASPGAAPSAVMASSTTGSAPPKPTSAATSPQT